METLTLQQELDLTEIINGEEVVSPSPFSKHQIISSNLFRKIDRHVEQKGLGRVFYSPLDVILEEGLNRLQPDILFIRKNNTTIIQDWIRGVPDMVCEIVSQGSFRWDTNIKKEIYEKYGVPEYWVIIPELKIFEVFTIEEGKYKLHSYAEGEGVVTSKVIGGLEVNIKDVFEG
ncbi:Uma2 family endonuclease [Candidatus Magnetominusculus dajiuhuensis]|uniref:Uma2 family endonuclease n=1 Tax=Candidatus Magnetominusculus dajiuhuensis TaxID=3137712 RepID=UPI003B430144